jgi:hypothetical protein
MVTLLVLGMLAVGGLIVFAAVLAFLKLIVVLVLLPLRLAFRLVLLPVQLLFGLLLLPIFLVVGVLAAVPLAPVALLVLLVWLLVRHSPSPRVTS